MKTTIDIPDALYKKAKIHAVESGQTLKQIMLTSLSKELEKTSEQTQPKRTFAERRILRPEFQRLIESGNIGAGTDSSIILSEDRSARENALL